MKLLAIWFFINFLFSSVAYPYMRLQHWDNANVMFYAAIINLALCITALVLRDRRIKYISKYHEAHK